MSAGKPLDDDDRFPWLETIGQWLAEHDTGRVMGCSALKRSYRDQLRRHAPEVSFLHLRASYEVIAKRQASRPGHFMPPSLLRSQLETLEDLDPHERGYVVDVGQNVDEIVRQYLQR